MVLLKSTVSHEIVKSYGHWTPLHIVCQTQPAKETWAHPPVGPQSCRRYHWGSAAMGVARQMGAEALAD